MRGSNRRGFTLMEMVFAMMVLAILLSVSFAGASYLWKGEEVESSARKMQAMMMRALRMSVANQRAYVVEFDATQIRLIQASDVLLAKESDDTVESVDQVSISPEVEIYVRRWEEDKWRAVEYEILNFPVSGICEPVRFRLVKNGDVLEFSLHPLTALPTKQILEVD